MGRSRDELCAYPGQAVEVTIGRRSRDELCACTEPGHHATGVTAGARQPTGREAAVLVSVDTASTRRAAASTAPPSTIRPQRSGAEPRSVG